MKLFLFLFILQIVVISCATKQKETQSNPNLLVIDLDDIKTKETVKASDFFKNPKSIILETNEKSLIGNIGQIYIDDDRIIIFDDSKNLNVLVFNSDGTFSHKIGELGRGAGEYISISDFTVDDKKDEIYLLDSEDAKVKKYSLSTGKFISSIPINSKRASMHIQYQDNNLYVDANIKSDEQSLLYQINQETGEEVASWLDADRYNGGWMERFTISSSFFLSRNANAVKYAQVFMDTVVSIHDNIISPFMVVKSDKWVKRDELLNAYHKHGIEAFRVMREQNKKYGIIDLIETNDGLFFQYTDGPIRRNVYSSNKETYSYTVLIDDIAFNGERFPLNLKWVDSKGVYSYCNPSSYASFIGGTLKDVINTNVSNYNELVNLEEDANPVLFYYEFK